MAASLWWWRRRSHFTTFLSFSCLMGCCNISSWIVVRSCSSCCRNASLSLSRFLPASSLLLTVHGAALFLELDSSTLELAPHLHTTSSTLHVLWAVTSKTPFLLSVLRSTTSGQSMCRRLTSSLRALWCNHLHPALDLQNAIHQL